MLQLYVKCLAALAAAALLITAGIAVSAKSKCNRLAGIGIKTLLCCFNDGNPIAPLFLACCLIPLLFTGGVPPLSVLIKAGYGYGGNYGRSTFYTPAPVVIGTSSPFITTTIEQWTPHQHGHDSGHSHQHGHDSGSLINTRASVKYSCCGCIEVGHCVFCNPTWYIQIELDTQMSHRPLWLILFFYSVN